ncbi:ABC transporter ATP-binding protein [Alphaproteobacteria bacterium]|nr:ABC transporter ATP-binding protein [Alphaproteobacteria bacterium]
MIEVDHLVKKFGDFTAVAGLSFRVERGQVMGFLGPNGAGKSTTMKMITGFLRPSSGTARIMGLDICDDMLAAQRHFGYLPEGAPAWPDMTPRAFLQFITRIRGLDKAAARAAEGRAIEMTELHGVLDQPIDTLSKGYRRRVGLAQAIVHDPDVLVMDEPTDGLDPNQKFQVRRAITDMAADKAIIISTHILEEVDAVCAAAMIIDRGQIVAEGTPSELAARSRYSGAVALTLETEKLSAAQAILAQIAHDSAEIVTRGDESTLHIFAQKGSEPGALLADLRARVGEAGLAPRALALETGRLDDVFGALTGKARPAPPIFSAEKETAS